MNGLVWLNSVCALSVALLGVILAKDSRPRPLCDSLPSPPPKVGDSWKGETSSATEAATDRGGQGEAVAPWQGQGSLHVDRYSASSLRVNCSGPGPKVAVDVRPHPKRHAATAVVVVCPVVKMVKLQVVSSTGSFLRVPGTVTVTSCAHTNDTAVIQKGRHRLHVTLQFSVSPKTSLVDRLNYSYSQHKNTNSLRHRKGPQEGRTAYQDGHVPETGSRLTRSVHDQSSESYTGTLTNVTSANPDAEVIVETVGCGETLTCIRYGFDGCRHLTCDYMLSYAVINSTDVDIEISGRGTGWVAVGFSSDKYMGGGDDVIGCKRDRKLSPNVVSMSLGNSVKHTQPREKSNRLELVDGLLHKDHIYCRIKRPLKYAEQLSDSDLDLFNDWHQLYAFGKIDGAGRIMRHAEKPRVSEKKITMVRVIDIAVVTSAASLPFASLTSGMCVTLLALALTFDGS